MNRKDLIRPNARMLIDVLKQKIKDGQLVPGQRLIEADIVKETGASRAHVREALQRMEAEGLIQIEEFKGASIKRLSRDEVSQIYRAREALEGMATRLFIERGVSSEKRQRLLSLQSELNAAALARMVDMYSKANNAFHSFIFEGAGNEYMASFLERLQLPIYRLQFRFLFQCEQMGTSNQDHFAVVDAILKEDPDAAESAMRNHVRHGLAEILLLDDSNFA